MCSINAVLSSILRRGTLTYRTQEEISKKLEEMYGAEFNCGLDKIGKASSYNVGAQNITPLLNNVGLQPGNVGTDNVRLPQLKDFL